MPGHRIGTWCVDVAESGVANAIVHDVDLGRTWKVGSEWMDDWWAEVFAETDDGRDWQVFEVLGAESDDFALGYKESEFVFCLTREAAQLDAGDHRACGG